MAASRLQLPAGREAGSWVKPLIIIALIILAFIPVRVRLECTIATVPRSSLVAIGIIAFVAFRLLLDRSVLSRESYVVRVRRLPPAEFPTSHPTNLSSHLQCHRSR